MLTNCAFDNMILKILIVWWLLFIFFFRHNLITISNDFILYIDNIRLAKIMIFTILNFSKIVIYKTRRYLNVSESYKNYQFIYNIILHAMLRLILFHSIENILRIIIWSSNYINFVNDNAIEVNFDDLLLEILHLSLIYEFDFINISSVDFRIHSLCIKLINIYDSNKEICFRKYINL